MRVYEITGGRERARSNKKPAIIAYSSHPQQERQEEEGKGEVPGKRKGMRKFRRKSHLK